MNKQLTLQDSLMVKAAYTLLKDQRKKRNTKDPDTGLLSNKELVWK